MKYIVIPLIFFIMRSVAAEESGQTHLQCTGTLKNKNSDHYLNNPIVRENAIEIEINETNRKVILSASNGSESFAISFKRFTTSFEITMWNDTIVGFANLETIGFIQKKYGKITILKSVNNQAKEVVMELDCKRVDRG